MLVNLVIVDVWRVGVDVHGQLFLVKAKLDVHARSTDHNGEPAGFTDGQTHVIETVDVQPEFVCESGADQSCEPDVPRLPGHVQMHGRRTPGSGPIATHARCIAHQPNVSDSEGGIRSEYSFPAQQLIQLGTSASSMPPPTTRRELPLNGFVSADSGYLPSDRTERAMEFLLWMVAVVFVVAGIVSLIRQNVGMGIFLIVAGLLIGPGGVSVFT